MSNHDDTHQDHRHSQQHASHQSKIFSYRNRSSFLTSNSLSASSHFHSNNSYNNSVTSINSLNNNIASRNNNLHGHHHPHSYQNPCVLTVIQGHHPSRRYSDLSIPHSRRLRTSSATNDHSLERNVVAHSGNSFNVIYPNNNNNWSSVVIDKNPSGIINECLEDNSLLKVSPKPSPKRQSPRSNGSRSPPRSNIDDDPISISVSDSCATNEDNSIAHLKSKGDDEETIWSSLKELMLAFFLAGLGNIAASYWYGKVQSWSVFKNIPQLVILVTPLLGLKGNVEMTLASRLSTHANLGDMDTKSSRNKLLMGNIALIQCQASTVGFIAPLIALGLSLIHDQSRILNWKQVVLLVASSVITANVANLILGSLMCGVIVLSRRFKINPDNIATPIAASLGDVTTMILLANISHFLYVNLETNQWVQNTLLAFLMSLIPVWAYIARKNPFTRKVILNGWYPVCGAMLIQNAGGLVMERALKSFNKIANLQLLINGVGGNLVAIQSSRMSTHLHKYSVMGDKNKDDDTIDCREKMKCNPLSTFSSSNPHSNFALLLLSISVPSHILFLFLTEVVNKKYFFTPSFIIIYLFVGVTQVMILLQFSYKFVHWLWSVKVNPDNSAIPFLTAIADLIGSLFLATAFNVLYAMRDPNAYTAVLSTVTSTVSRSLPMTPSPFPLNNQHVLASPTSPMFSTTTPLPVITSVNTTHF